MPTSNIIHEGCATATCENMEFPLPIPREFGARQVVVIRSWL